MNKKSKQTKLIMIQGTSSSVGKSLLAAALCRIFYQDGLKVAPFKAINISLNSGVTEAGGEMARSQIVQAASAGVIPEVLMNPILIKPQINLAPQVVRLGKVIKVPSVKKGDQPRDDFWPVIKSSFNQLLSRFKLVVIEGSGSPAEPNFISGDIANLKIAKYASSPVILVGDIDQGGVFASLEGTIAILKRHDPAALKLIKGFIINKYQGEKGALAPALRELTKVSGIPVLGVVPFIQNHGIEDEDTWGLTDKVFKKSAAILDVVIIRTPSLQNSTDFDPLVAHPSLQVRFISQSRNFGNPDLVILPGSKNTIADLNWLRSFGLAEQILKFASLKKALIGICGGFQMLGKVLRDPNLVESSQSKVAGLGLLNIETVFQTKKLIRQTSLTISSDSGLLKGAKNLQVKGFEIHLGKTIKSGRSIKHGQNGWAFGSYLHDIFKNENFRNLVLKNIAEQKGLRMPEVSLVEAGTSFDQLAEVIRANVDLKQIYQIIDQGVK